MEKKLLVVGLTLIFFGIIILVHPAFQERYLDYEIEVHIPVSITLEPGHFNRWKVTLGEWGFTRDAYRIKLNLVSTDFVQVKIYAISSSGGVMNLFDLTNKLFLDEIITYSPDYPHYIEIRFSSYNGGVVQVYGDIYVLGVVTKSQKGTFFLITGYLLVFIGVFLIGFSAGKPSFGFFCFGSE